MYTDYFGLREKPFSIAPDPRYLYMTAQHQEALAHLLYGLDSDGGFILLTGEVGTGKTTVCRRLLNQIPERVDLAVIFNPKLSVLELLETICDELLIPRPAQASAKTLVDLLNAHLLETNASGRKTVLIIDEAQNLSSEVLEQLRLLTNLETDQRKLLQIVLLGQPELRSLLGRVEMRQLAQRITARYHLGPLNRREVQAYVRHRLEIAGCTRPIFTPAAIGAVHNCSKGIPRLVNLVCDRALLGAYTRNLDTVTPAIVRQAAREVLFPPSARRRLWLAPVLATGLLLAVAAAVLLRQGWSPTPFERPVAAAAKVVQPAASETLPREWPVSFAAAQDDEAALIDLAALWGVAIPPGAGGVCRFVESKGLRCLERQDSLSALRAVNRPAVLTLYDDQGASFHVLLAGLDGPRAHFATGTESRVLDVAVLESRWFGDVLYLWQPPSFYTQAVSPGEGGPVVPWLAGSLESLGLYARNGREKRLDGQLLGALKRYQMMTGLVPDGTLGPQTLINLMTALGQPGPRLTPAGKVF